MDATTLIQQHFDVNKLLMHYDFDKVKSEGEIIRACCKLHGGNNPTAFAINSETGLWFCHTGACGGGDIFTLVQKMEEMDFPSSVRWLADFYDVDINDLRITEKKSFHTQDLQQFIKMIKSKRKTVLLPFYITEEVKQVVKYRNFTEATLQHFSVGHVEHITLTKRNGGDYILHNRLLVPLIVDGVQVGISLRRLRNKDFPKWSHQPAHIKTNEILYNYDSILQESIIAVCEGITDVWAFYEISVPAVCTFGSHISEEQYKMLLKTGADLVFAFDGDAAGRIVTQRAVKLFKNKANIFTINFCNNEDPESITRKELEERYEDRKKM